MGNFSDLSFKLKMVDRELDNITERKTELTNLLEGKQLKLKDLDERLEKLKLERKNMETASPQGRTASDAKKPRAAEPQTSGIRGTKPEAQTAEPQTYAANDTEPKSKAVNPQDRVINDTKPKPQAAKTQARVTNDTKPPLKTVEPQARDIRDVKPTLHTVDPGVRVINDTEQTPQAVKTQERVINDTEPAIQTSEHQARDIRDVKPTIQTAEPQARDTNDTKPPLKTIEPQARDLRDVKPALHTIDSDVRVTNDTEQTPQAVKTQERVINDTEPMSQEHTPKTGQPQHKPKSQKHDDYEHGNQASDDYETGDHSSDSQESFGQNPDDTASGKSENRARFAEIDAEMDQIQETQRELELDVDEIQSELGNLDKKSSALQSKREGLLRGAAPNPAQTGFLKKGIKTTQSAVGRAAQGAMIKAKGAAQGGANKLKGVVKKADPFEKPINKNDTADTGVESIRLANKTVQGAINAVKTSTRTVKTTARTIGKIGNFAARAAKTTAKVTYKTVQKTIKASVILVNFIVSVFVNVIAIAMNPIVWVAAGLLVILVGLSSLVVLLGGGSNTTAGGAGVEFGAVGLGKVSEQYSNGLEYLGEAKGAKYAEYEGWVNGVSYNASDLSGCGLISMEAMPSEASYNTDFNTDFLKAALLGEWDWEDYGLSDNMVLAIAYALLQKEANADKGTSGSIYNVEYTQEVITKIVDMAVSQSAVTYDGVTCPGASCVYVPAVYDLEDPTTIVSVAYYTCYGHSLTAISLSFLTADEIMEALEFNDIDKRLAENTAKGFDSGMAGATATPTP